MYIVRYVRYAPYYMSIWMKGAPLNWQVVKKINRVTSLRRGCGPNFFLSKGKVQITWPLDKCHTFCVEPPTKQYGTLYARIY